MLSHRGWPRAATAKRIALGVAALLCVSGCRAGEAGDSADAGGGPPETVVEVVSVEPQLLAHVVDIPGQLAAEMTVEIHPEVEGILESIEFSEGDFVEKDRILFRLRDDSQRAVLHEAEAQLALAEATHKRTLTLAGRKVSSAAQLEQASAELSVARARVEAAAVHLERTRVKAPFEGTVGALQVAPGDRVRTRSTLVRIDAVDRLQLLFYLTERAVGMVEPGMPVRIAVAPWPKERFDGEVYFVSPTLEAAGRRILIKAWMPNPDHRLRPGMFASIEAEVSRREDALLVPESALVHELDGTYVWRIDDERRARRVPVEVGLRRRGEVEIAEGLAPGDVVVATGTHKVRAGGLVRAAGSESAVSAPGDKPRVAREPEPERSGES
jgi:membrane fusion protein (multidrug efflux system)